jgi:hypothetical protein
MLTRWQGWPAAAGVTLVTLGLVLGDLDDAGFRRWWSDHPLTTDTVAGLLVLLITVLVADQLVRRQQVRDRSRAVAAQAAIVTAQAARSAKAVSATLEGSGDRDAAADEVRTYMIMLSVGAPVLIDARISRTFLEEAQRLGGEMAYALSRTNDAKATSSAAAAQSSARLHAAVERLRTASTPLLQVLDHADRVAVGAVAGTTAASPAETQPETPAEPT